MSQPISFEDSSKPNHVCLLKKSIYGLKHHQGSGTLSLMSACCLLVLLEASLILVYI
ncbi:unnamed protein product [Rhodiola kirilowii]